MITPATWERSSLFSTEPWAGLIIDTLLLHEFVIMPDPIQVLVTPKTGLEKAVQVIKGGFSYRAEKELGSNMGAWQKGRSDHRIRDAGDGREHVSYIRQKPVGKRWCKWAREYPYSSARAEVELDPVPQGIKPALNEGSYGASEAAPFQSKISRAKLEIRPDRSQSKTA